MRITDLVPGEASTHTQLMFWLCLSGLQKHEPSEPLRIEKAGESLYRYSF